MSDLWLDTELEDGHLEWIASEVRGAGLGRTELDHIFRFELAPFLGTYAQMIAGEWREFDPEWVCEQAAKRVGRPTLWARFIAWTKYHTSPAQGSWERVLGLAFSPSRPE